MSDALKKPVKGTQQAHDTSRKPVKNAMTEKEKAYWRDLYDYVRYTVLKYDSNQSLSPDIVLHLRGLKFGKVIDNRSTQDYADYSFRIILMTFLFVKSNIDWALRTKHFQNDNMAIRYICKIVANNINEVYQRDKAFQSNKEMINAEESEEILPEHNPNEYDAFKKVNKKFKKYIFQERDIISENDRTLSAKEKEIRDIKNLKLGAEANIVSILYLHPDIFPDLDIELTDFSHNEWRVYYEIARGCLEDDKLKVLDAVTVSLYTRKHPKLEKIYNECGGYDTIVKAGTYVKYENIFAYINDLKKYNCLLKLAENGFIFGDKLREFKDMDASDIYDEYTIILQDAFLKTNDNAQVYSIGDGLDDLYSKLDEGDEIGLPFDNAHLLTERVNGINLNGKIYGLGANSGVGKTTTMINYVLPTVIKYNVPTVITINEEDQTKIQKEMIVWLANNHFGGYMDSMNKRRYIKKERLARGHFNQEPTIKDLVIKSIDFLKGLKEKNLILIIPLHKYTVKQEIRILRKYAKLGYKLFVLDTFKESSDINANVQSWKSMERDMRNIYDVIKPTGLNVTLFFTYQLTKSSAKLRYYTNNDVGQSKNILDVIDCNIMMRRPFKDEYAGKGKHEIIYEHREGKNKQSIIKNKLDENKKYMITFVTKNRFGESDGTQIVSEYNLSTNMHKDVGETIILEDF